MTYFKVNNRPAVKSWNGLVNDLFANLENNYSQATNGSAPVNIAENDEAYHLELAAPGRKKENFSLQVDNGTLTVSYEHKKDEQAPELKSVRSEFAVQSLKRSFNLDENVNAEGIQAKYEDGILKVVLPKKAQVKPEVKQINVQ